MKLIATVKQEFEKLFEGFKVDVKSELASIDSRLKALEAAVVVKVEDVKSDIEGEKI